MTPRSAIIPCFFMGSKGKGWWLELLQVRRSVVNRQEVGECAHQSHSRLTWWRGALADAQVLEARVGELRQALALSRQTEDELARRNTVYQSTIRQLVRPPPPPPPPFLFLPPRQRSLLRHCFAR